MHGLTAAILFAVAVLCLSQKVPSKRTPEAGTQQTVVIRADSIRVSRPNTAPAVQGGKPGSGLRILVISTKPDATTSQLMHKVAEVLAGSGHHVTLISSTSQTNQPLASGVILKKLDYGLRSEALVNVLSNIRVMDRLRAVSHLSQDMLAFCEKVFDRMDVIDWIRIQKFDIAVTSGATSVIVTSAEPVPWITRTMGMPEFENPLIKEMPYFQRVKTVISGHIEETLLQSKLLGPLDEMGRRMVGDRYISMKDAVGQSSFLVVNTDELLDFPRPLTSQWVYIGGIDSKKRSSLSPVLEAFSEIPDITFIWHREDSASLNQSNVVVVQKFPGKDLLADSRVSAIITDGRVESLHDILSGGKPVVCIPSDHMQMRNCHQLGKRGVAAVTDCRDLTPSSVKEMIKQTATTEMRHSAKILSEAVTSKQTSPEERLIRTVEFAAKYGSSVDLHSNDDVGIVQRYHLDVFIPLALLLATVVLLVAWIARSAWDKCKKNRSQEKPKAESGPTADGDSEKPDESSSTEPEGEEAVDESKETE
ncbi:UDP-glucoronosyl and UDP-glucosyl transferase [Ancylostoma ceylanicum]|uniref:glucuronosyltransferase n=1 Tax=Ancylostoma ceylanicum TaxID=53326 RepID=A0A0D6MDL9_9BILA|nr:UDP-glucoronosyl and UDP-glucosyl transferase [Ancylostoma ceylanicum]